MLCSSIYTIEPLQMAVCENNFSSVFLRSFFTFSGKTVDNLRQNGYNHIRCSQQSARSWRNRHTRTFEGRVLNRVRVQVPSTAPVREALKPERFKAFFVLKNRLIPLWFSVPVNRQGFGVKREHVDATVAFMIHFMMYRRAGYPIRNGLERRCVRRRRSPPPAWPDARLFRSRQKPCQGAPSRNKKGRFDHRTGR